MALTGLAALEPGEAVYINCSVDAERRPHGGAGCYELTFPADGLPPARACWSLTMCEGTPEGRAFLVENPTGRYVTGDRTPGLSRSSDGSLTLYLQHERQGDDRAANWLPAPGGPMRLVLRAYEPGEPLIEGRYRIPAVRRVGYAPGWWRCDSSSALASIASMSSSLRPK